MKRLFSALSAVFALIALSAAVCAVDVLPDNGGVYNIEYRGESFGEYTLLVLKGVYGEDQLETLLSKYADSDVMYRGYAAADESGLVSFDNVIPRSYSDSTAIIGGTGLEKPRVAAILRSDGALDAEKLKFSELEDVYTVNGSLGEDIEINLEALTYDSFGYPSLEQPKTEYFVSGVGDNSSAYLSADRKALVINRYAKDMTFEVSAKAAELSDSTEINVKRAQRVPCEIKAYTDEELTNAVSSLTVHGTDGVFSPAELYFGFTDNFGDKIESSAVVECGGKVITGNFVPEKAGTYVLTAFSADNRDVFVNITVEALERPDYTGGALELYEKTAEAKEILGGKNIRIFVSAENGNDIYPGTRWTTESEFNKLSAQTDSASDTLKRFSDGEIADSVAKATARNLSTVLTKFNSSLKDGKRIDADSITLNITEVTLAYGKSATPKVTLSPAKNTEKITWSSSDDSVATVSQSGVIKASGKGTAVITAQTRNGIKAFCTVYAVRPITKLVTSESKISLIVGANDYQLSYTAFPEDNNDTARWYSSNEKVATVSDEGMVHAVSDGNAKIYVESSGKKKAYTTVSVGLGADKVSFTSAPLALAVGKNTALKASASRIDGKRPINRKAVITQISGEEYGYYAPNGKLYGLKPGKVVMMAEAVTSLDKVSTVIEIDIVIPASSVKMSHTKLAMVAGGEDFELSAAISPENSTESLTWQSSNHDIADVDENGVVTALSKGTAKITARTGSGKTATCTVTVGLGADMVEFTSKITSAAVGKTLALKAVASRADKQRPVSTAVRYEIISGNEFAEIDDSGKLKALAVGTVTVRAYAEASINRAYDDIVINVVVPVTSLKFTTARQSAVVGDNPLNLYEILTVQPFDNTDILTWSSSNKEVADVDENGNVTAHSKGTAKITVMSGSGKRAVCTFTVGLGADMVEFTNKITSAAVGKTLALKAVASRADKQRPVSTAVRYEIISGNEFAEIDDSGKLKALAVGTVTVRAYAEASINRAYDDIVINVVVPVTSLKFTTARQSAVVGDNPLNLYEILTVQPFDNTDILTWSSSNKEVADVDENGNVTAHSKGTAKITVMSGSGKRAVCTFTVGLGADSVKITKPSSLSLAAGKTLTLKASAVREDSQKPVSSEVIWESSDESIAAIDARGKVTASHNFGSVTFTAFAKCGTGSDSITVNVVPELYSLKAQSTVVSMEEGQSVEILPMLTAVTRDGEVIDVQTYCEITYKSTSAAIVSVSSDGIAEGIKKGRTTVKVAVKCASAAKSITITFNITEPSADSFDEETSDNEDNTDNEIPSNAEIPENITKPEIPENPENGETSDNSQDNALPETPDNADVTDSADGNENSGNSDNADNSENTETADTEKVSENSENAQNGENLFSENTESQENPENAENAESHETAGNTDFTDSSVLSESAEEFI